MCVYRFGRNKINGHFNESNFIYESTIASDVFIFVVFIIGKHDIKKSNSKPFLIKAHKSPNRFVQMLFTIKAPNRQAFQSEHPNQSR